MNETVNKRKCDLCQLSTDTTGLDTVRYGDWQTKSKITVHYFCLLLSTNLAQRGTDNCGILGFLIHDIRREIKAAAKRNCVFCNKSHASISCKKCKDYFHLVCGDRQDCLFQFYNSFDSFCGECLPLEEKHQQNLIVQPSLHTRCFICHDTMGQYSPLNWIHAICCGNGYSHRLCMQEYALSAGYYLICIWCKDKSFREYIKSRGIFVPDREANWERQKGAYHDFHRGHSRCDMPRCLCPRGRDYTFSKWSLILCTLCGSFGAHNPICIVGSVNSKTKIKEFKCETCKNTEELINKRTQEKSLLDNEQSVDTNEHDNLDTSIYLQKTTLKNIPKIIHETIEFSDQESFSSLSSCVTVIPRSAIMEVAACAKAFTYGCIDLVPVFSEPQSTESSESTQEFNLLEAKEIDSCARTTFFKYVRKPLKNSLQQVTEQLQTTNENLETTLKDSCARTTHFKYVRNPSNSQPQLQTIISKNKEDKEIQNTKNYRKKQKNSEKYHKSQLSQIMEENEITILESPTTKNKSNVASPVQEQANRNLFSPSPEEISTNQPFDSANENCCTQIPNDNINSIVDTYFDSDPTGSQFYYYSPQDEEFVNNLRSKIALSDAVTISECEILPTSQNFQEHFGIFEVYEVDKDKNDVLRRCRSFINFQDSRFVGKSLKEIQNTPGLLSADDIIGVYDDIGIFEEINKIIDQNNLKT